jgi:putative membrane protein
MFFNIPAGIRSMAYEKTGKGGLVLRDELAIQRTVLAEERTYLAYIRTGMSLILGGFFFIGYFEHGSIFSYVGYATVAISLVFIAYGFYNHKKSMALIKRITLGIFGPERKAD